MDIYTEPKNEGKEMFFQVINLMRFLPSLFVLTYGAEANEKNTVCLFNLPENGEAAAYLLSNFKKTVKTEGSVNAGGHWDNEHENYLRDEPITVCLEDETAAGLTEWCKERNTTMDILFCGISCFLCNSWNSAFIFAWFKEYFNEQTLSLDE